MIFYTELQGGLADLRKSRSFDDYKIVPAMAKKLQQLAVVDEGVYFYSLLGYLNLEDSSRHPLYDGRNRGYTAYLVGVERMDELNKVLDNVALPFTDRITNTLLYVLAFQHDACFIHVGTGVHKQSITWNTFFAQCIVWVGTRADIIGHVATQHHALDNVFYRATLRDMTKIVAMVYRKKTFTEVARTFENHSKAFTK